MQSRRTGLEKLFPYVAVAALLVLGTAPAQAKKEVRLDHPTQTIVPSGTIGLYPDELLVLTVTGTSRLCYTFNLKEFDRPQNVQEGDRVPIAWEDVPIPVIHRPGVIAYEVEVRKRTNLSPKLDQVCEQRSDHTFRIPVETYEWRLAFAGAFTGDGLTDPVFYLEEGVENPDAPAEMQTDGFFVRERPGAEDSYTLGAAAMVHLFHNDPIRFDFKQRVRPDEAPTIEEWRDSSAGLVHWAPLSFGLGVGEDSETRYYLGSSLRFGEKAFLTAGWVFGSRDRLPNGLGRGDFTQEANALGSLASETGSAFFLSVSFDFLDVGPSSFTGPFQAERPSSAQEESGRDAAEEESGDAEGKAESDEERSIREALNERGPASPFGEGIFSDTFEGERFCRVDVTATPAGITVELSLEALADPKILSAPDADADLMQKNAAIREGVEKVASKVLGKPDESLPVTLGHCNTSEDEN